MSCRRLERWDLQSIRGLDRRRNVTFLGAGGGKIGADIGGFIDLLGGA